MLAWSTNWPESRAFERPLTSSASTVSKMLQYDRIAAVAQGFRSSCREWAGATMSVTLSSLARLGSTIATWAGLMKTSPSASWRLKCTRSSGCLPRPSTSPRPGRLSPSSSSASALDVGGDESCAARSPRRERKSLLEVARVRAEPGTSRSAVRTDSTLCALAGSQNASHRRETARERSFLTMAR